MNIVNDRLPFVGCSEVIPPLLPCSISYLDSRKSRSSGLTESVYVAKLVVRITPKSICMSDVPCILELASTIS